MPSYEVTDSTKYSDDDTGVTGGAKHDGVVADTSEFTTADESEQCGQSSCLPDSVVGSIANFIRAHGYHIRHDDICEARSGTANLETLTRTCNLKHVPVKERTYQCKAQQNVTDQYISDETCSVFTTDVPGSDDYGDPDGNSDCDDAADCYENDDRCLATPAFLLAKECTANSDADIVPKTCGDAYCMNQVKKVVKFSVVLQEENVGDTIDNFKVLTGAADGCRSLRGLVLAINGAHTEQRFVEYQHEHASRYWRKKIDDSRSIYETIMANIKNMNGLTKYFYDFENAPQFQCDSNFAPFNDDDPYGDEMGPKCDTLSYETFQDLETTESMGQRSSCFCRSFKADDDDDLSVDEVYLQTAQPTCSQYKYTLPSVYSYCEDFKQLSDKAVWEKELNALDADTADMPAQLNTWYTAHNNNGKTGKQEVTDNFDNSIAGYGKSCGRISSADPDVVKLSNKGANCVPFQGVEHVVYRLEYEFFGDAAVDRKNTNTTEGTTLADMACVANPTGDQIVSFRQLAYRYDRNSTLKESDDNTDDIDTGNLDESQLYNAAASDKCGDENCYEPMCSVDYAQLLGGGSPFTDGDTQVADPIAFYKRDIDEASTQVALTYKANNAAENALDMLWSRFRAELTDTTYNTETQNAATQKKLVADIGKSATEHFTRIAMHSDGGDALTGVVNMCSKNTVFTKNVGSAQLLDCKEVEKITVDSTVANFTLGTLAVSGATSLDEAVLPPDTSVGVMSFTNIKDGAKILFKTEKYDAGSSDDDMNVEIDAVAEFDTGTKCGIKCDDDYAANEVPTNSLCDTNTETLNELYCRYEPAAAELSNKTGVALKTFITKQITRPTTIDENTCGTDSGVKVMEFYLGGDDCGSLTFGDMTGCTELTHIYVHTDTVYGGYGQADGTDACPNGTGTVSFTEYTSNTNLKLFWTNGPTPSGMTTSMKFDVPSSQLPLYMDSTSSRDELCVGGEHYLVAGNASLSDGLTESCQNATEIVLPDSVTQLGVGFSIRVQTAPTKELTIWVGERLVDNTNGPSIHQTATILPNNSTHVAKIMRRCPSTNVPGYNHPGYDRVANSDKFVNAFAYNTVDSFDKSDYDEYGSARYYDMREGDSVQNCISQAEA